MSYSPVQTTNQANSSTLTTINPVYTNTPVAGNLLLCSTSQTGTTTTPTVSDSNGNWTLLNSGTPAAGRSMFLFGLIAASSQPTSISVTNAASTALWASLYEFSGNNISISAIIDNNQNNNSGNSGTATTSSGSQPSVTSTNPNDLLFTSIMFAGGVVTSPAWTTSGGATVNTLQSNASGAIRLFDGYAIETSTGTFNPFATWTNARTQTSLTTLLLPPPNPQTLNNYQFIKDNAGGDTGILSFTEKIK